jgi:hypothetical protein
MACNKQLESQMCTYTRGSKLCLSCSRKKSHENPKSKYNSIEYKQKRSRIASESNKKRKINSERYLKYLPYLEKLKDNKITFLEISKELGLDDSTVCKFFHNNFNLKSKTNYSVQEKYVGDLLKKIFNKVEVQKRYSSNSRHKSDFYIENIGHIEYDGNGFYHIKQSDEIINEKYNPIRLDAQAYFGGIDYLHYKLLKYKKGYCAVKTVKEYKIKEIENRKLSSQMLENCHRLGNCAGTKVFGLFYNNLLIGVAKFGLPTNKNDEGLELRRFFILDGTPKNTESYFLRQCEKQLSGKLITYIHAHEKGSYLKALNWEKQLYEHKIYDCYLVQNKMINKRRFWGWAKKIGLVDKFGTTDGKKILAKLLNAKTVYEPSKIKFIKEL